MTLDYPGGSNVIQGSFKVYTGGRRGSKEDVTMEERQRGKQWRKRP